MQRHRFIRGAAIAAVWALTAAICATAAPPPVTPAAQESAAFRDFTRRVQQYVKLVRVAPRQRKTKKLSEIVARRDAQARNIRSIRANAKQGDIFTPEISAAFEREIRRIFHGPNASKVRRTIRQGAPVTVWHPSVNGDYPDSLPLTTVPPSLLLHLPQLPQQVAYRIVGHDFVLQDVQARVVVDFIPGVIP